MSDHSEYSSRVQNIQIKHSFEKYFFDLYGGDYVDLAVGAPGPELLENCCEMFENATKQRLGKQEKKDKSQLFQYGATTGRLDFRIALANFLTEQYQNPVNSEDLVLTSGATQGLHLILSTLIDMPGYIFVDDVTFMLALDIMYQFPMLKIIPVPLTKNGTDIDKFRELLEKHKPDDLKPKHKNKLFWAVYYTIPVYHNPTGIVYSAETCKKLIDLSREYDFLIQSDDVYNLLNYTSSTPPDRLFSMDNMADENYKGNIISNGSFSKILSPGLRIGWLECPPRCVRAFMNSGIIRSSGGSNNYTSGVVTTLLESGAIKKNLQKYCQAYKKNMQTICEILKNNLPPTCEFDQPEGGFFVWIKFAKHIDSNEFNKYATDKYKVFGLMGKAFSCENEFRNCLRISIGFYDNKKISKAVMDLCTAYKEFEKLKSNDN